MTRRKRALTPTFSSDPISPGHEFSTPKRAKVQQLDRDGYSRAEIRVRTHVPERTQRTMINKTENRPGKKRSGAPKKIDEETLGKMIKSLQGCYNQRIKPWDIFAEDFRPPTSTPTTRLWASSYGGNGSELHE